MAEVAESAIPETNTLSTESLQAMIAQLSVTEEGESLRTAMDDLKAALKANPAACASLLDEDIGKMVDALMKVTGREIEEDMADGRKKGTKKQPKLDLSKLDDKSKQELEDDLF